MPDDVNNAFSLIMLRRKNEPYLILGYEPYGVSARGIPPLV